VPKRLPRLFAAPAESPGFLLWQAANRWQQRQRAALAPLGLTPVQFVLLAGVAALAEDDTPPTQARVARHVRADAMMTSQVIRALERPTAAGRKLARQAAYVVDDADRAFFESVGADRARLAEALGALAGVGEEPV
jgi:hypothetical protein